MCVNNDNGLDSVEAGDGNLNENTELKTETGTPTRTSNTAGLDSGEDEQKDSIGE